MSTLPPVVPSINDLNEQYINSFYQDDIVSDYVVLKIAIDEKMPSTQFDYWLDRYTQHIETHNETIRKSYQPNAGFDLFVVNTTVFAGDDVSTVFLDLGVKCELIYCKKSVDKYIDAVYNPTRSSASDEIGLSYNSGFFLYPRSSISKTPLMLANHTGIIDSGYRGNLVAATRSLSKTEYTVDQGTRLFQIVSPNMCPIYVVLVPEAELGLTERGSGGFGSTGFL
jgi:dUTP pyrophosphatase